MQRAEHSFLHSDTQTRTEFMFRAKQHSLRLKSLSDLTFVFLSVREAVVGREIDSRAERRREGKGEE